jgi:hypothetical protein
VPGDKEWNPERIDLRAKLAEALKAGWTIQALKDYAHNWLYPGCEHVTPSAWRIAVLLADNHCLAQLILGKLPHQP